MAQVAMFREPRARIASECAALHAEFVRAFSSSSVFLGRRLSKQPREGKPRRRRRPKQAWSHSQPTVEVAIKGIVHGGAGSAYANPFMREFLFAHGFSHHAIHTMSAKWNETRTLPLDVCLRVEGIRGCQTKMVLGVPCAAPFALNASLLAEAVRRVSGDFMFVGLTHR